MSHACCDGAESRAPRATTALRLADGLALAASPTFAGMGLLSALAGGDPAAMICSAGHLSALTGMATMYLLMSAFHIGPWLRLIAGPSRPEKAAAIWRVKTATGLTEGARSR